MKGNLILGTGIFRFGKKQAHDQEVPGVYAHVGLVDIQEAANHQACPGQEHDSERHLGDHKERREVARARPAARTAASFSKRSIYVEPGKTEGGRESEQEPGADGYDGQIGETAVIQREVHPGGNAVADRGVEDPHAPDGDQPSEHARDGRQHDAFDQQLPDDPPAAGAEGDANGDFTRPVHGARQQQVRHVGAGDQEHERHRSHQGGEQHSNLRTIELFAKGVDHRRDSLIGVRIFLFEIARDGRDFGGGGLLGGSWRHFAESGQVAGLALFGIGPGNEGGPQLGIHGKFQVLGHHTDHGSGDVVNANRLAENACAPTVAVLPNSVAQNGYRGGAGLSVVGREVAAQHRLLADHGKRVDGDLRDIEA